MQVFLLVLLIDSLRADLLTALHAVVVRVLLVLTCVCKLPCELGCCFIEPIAIFDK